METLYWLFQYFYVLIAFGFIMFIWPLVVFRKHLKGKTRTYRFAFCVVTMILLLNTVVIALGLLHLLNQVIFCLLFYGIFLYSIFKGKRVPHVVIKRFKSLIGGTYKPKSMFLDIFRFIKKKIKEFWSFFKCFMKGHWGVYILLGIVVLWGWTYFSYGALSDYSFGCGDVYVHCEWIYNLFEGKIFFAGIYPEAMHIFIFSESALTGVQMYSAILFTQSVNVAVLLVSMYLLFREFFKWRYSPILALMLCVTVNVVDANEVYTLSRIQWSLPQEFGYPAMFLCAAFLVRFLKRSIVKKKTKEQKELEKKSIKLPIIKKTIRVTVPLCFKDENLYVFMMAMSATLAVHFYATIMAFYFCVGIAIVFIRKIFSRKFLPLATSVIIGFMIAVVPMVVSFMSGIRLQGSLKWAMSIFMPSSSESEEVDEVQTETKEESSNVNTEQAKDTTDTLKDNKTTDSGIGNVVATKTINGSANIVAVGIGVWEKVKDFVNRLHTQGYQPLHDVEMGDFYFHATWVALLIGIAGCLFSFVITKIRKKKYTEDKSYAGYIVLAVIAVICHFSNFWKAYGIPYIMEPYRIYGMSFFTCVITLVVPLDFIISLFMKKMHAVVSAVLGTAFVIGIYVTCLTTGRFRGYMVYQLTRYNSAVMLTNQIVKTMPKDSYTIVSSTDELYQIIGHGFHEEVVRFINEAEVVSYTLPTDYIFIFVEKNAIYRNQDHFFVGPSWFAQNRRYFVTFPGKNSEGDNLRKQVIDENLANVYFGKMPLKISVYGILWQRVVLNSKLFVWCQKFNAMYPNELHVYYEDEDLLCYYLHQNPRNLYELAAFDPSVMVSPADYDNPIWPEKYNAGFPKNKDENGQEEEDEMTEKEKREKEREEKMKWEEEKKAVAKDETINAQNGDKKGDE